ncbi:hypothetical protein TD95_000613 [Thielaviopsis punctulata]|uniref:Ketoreductase (KR) domain-containing protein n=1 Tax=Thielaviopsis punctulata TaxID=72032 RepID=A0A0F4ZK18_9PEZI|nr:hypothetical protein TD95_000613 [Thielaviopsis punctulata]
MSSITPASLFSAEGMVCFVTGGGSGVGLTITEALVAGGAAKVYIGGRRRAVLDAAVTRIGKPDVVIPVSVDVTSVDALREAAAFVARDSGYLNLLVCNAGIGGPQVEPPKEGISAAEWAEKHLAQGIDEYTQTFAVNVSSVWFTTMAFLGLLELGTKKRNVTQTSSVIVISSIAGYNKVCTGGWAYGQSKAGATHVVKHLSLILPQWGIRSNFICPGLFPSDMSAPIIEKHGIANGDNALPTSMVPMGRMGDSMDMAGAVLYLASRAGAYCHGTGLVLDGGRLCTFSSTY